MASYMIWKIDNKYNLDLGAFVGPLGLAGQTAWVGLDPCLLFAYQFWYTNHPQ